MCCLVANEFSSLFGLRKGLEAMLVTVAGPLNTTPQIIVSTVDLLEPDAAGDESIARALRRVISKLCRELVACKAALIEQATDGDWGYRLCGYLKLYYSQ
jgi:hypothetical protein